VSEHLSLRRLRLLIRNDVAAGYRTLALVSATVGLLSILGPAGLAYADRVEAGFYRSFFIGVLLIWGTIATSISFRDLHGRSTNAAFLLLPATALEKTLSRLLLNTVLLIAYLLLLMSLLSLIGEVLELAGITRSNDWFSPLDRVAWTVIPHYLVLQSVFFLGAAWFRKLHYVKTLLSVAVLVAGLSGITFIVGWLLFFGTVFDVADDGLAPPVLVENISPLAYFVALPLFCWWTAWLRVKESQVSHGV
jgi:hypothetical protein